MDDEFDLNEVHRLVDEVLGGMDASHAPQPRLSDIRIPFGIYDTKLLQYITEVGEKIGLVQADTQMLLDECRSKLTLDLDLGSLRDLHSLTLNCRRCPELGDASLPFGNLTDPDIVFVLDYPTDEWPKELLEILDETSIDPSRAMITFATRCRASRGVSVGEQEIENCSPYLFGEIQLLSPKLIIPMGSATASEFIHHIKVSDDHGTIFWIGPWAIMPVYALGYLGRRDSARTEMVTDLTKAKNFLYGTR